jgi:cysteine-rich repeat protein
VGQQNSIAADSNNYVHISYYDYTNRDLKYVTNAPIFCGNGTIEPDEQCDDGNTISGDGCSAICITEFCGDGILQAVLGEQCDEGNTVSGDGCSATCQLESCTLLSPNGGETIPSGSIYTIRWTAPPGAVKFTLKYSINNGSTWKLIASNRTGTSYDWHVPTLSNNKTNCLVKVIGFNSSGAKVGEDISDSTFTIEVIKVTSPDGGEILTSGGTHTITWLTNGTIRPVANTKLFRSINGGTSWTAIKTVSGNPGSYIWTVPNVSSSNCKVKVVLKDSGGVTVGSDMSDGVFTIQ